jgi:hypothetical protein
MAVNITKNQLLVFFIKIDSYNYKCKTCNKVYKTPNGGIGNLRTHYLTHLKDPSDKVVLGKRKLQTILLPTLPNTETFETDPDEPQTVAIISVSICTIPMHKMYFMHLLV